MAPPKERDDTPILDQGVYTPGHTPTLTGRQDPFWGGARDLGIDVATAAVDVLAMPFAYTRDVGRASGTRSMELAGQLGQRSAIDVKDWMRSGKTAYQQQEDRTGNENRTWIGSAVDTIVGSVPTVATAVFSGYPALAYGAMAGAQQSTEFEEQLYNMPREDLTKTPVFQEAKARGLSDADAMRAVHTKMRTDPAAWMPNVGANVIFGGVAGRVMGKIGTRTIAQTMTQNIMRNVGQDVPEGAIGGALTGLGQGWGRQQGQIAGGLRQETDWGEVGKEAWEMGTTLGGVSTATALARSRRPRSADISGRTAEDLLKDAGGKKIADEIGTEQRVVATENLNDVAGPKQEVPSPPRQEAPTPVMPDTGVPGPARAPEAPLAPEFPVIERPGLPDVGLPREEEAIAPPVVPGGTRAPTIAEQIQERIATRKAAQEATPAFTVDQLKERAADITQTPDVGALQQHIAEWKEANPGKKLAEQNEVYAIGKATREAARKQKIAEKQTARELARSEKAQEALAKTHAKLARQQAETLKAAKPGEEVTPPGKPPTKPIEAIKPIPEVVEEVVEEQPGPLGEARIRETLKLKPKGEGVVSGEAAEPGIAQQRVQTEQRAQEALATVAEGERERERVGRATESQAVRRDPKYSARETAAREVLETHKPGSNAAAELDRIEGIVKEGVPDAPAVREEVGKLVKDIAAIVSDYQTRSTALGFKLAATGGRSRAGKGEHHSFMSDLHNLVIDINKAVEKGDHTRAKELTLKYLEDSRRVREGEIGKVSEARKAKSDAVSVETKTRTGKEGDTVESLTPKDLRNLGEVTNKAEEDVTESLTKNPVKPITPAQASQRGWGTPRRTKHGLKFDPAYHWSTMGGDADFVPGVRDVLNPSRVRELHAATMKLAQKLGHKLSPDEFATLARSMGERVEIGTLADALKDIRPKAPVLRAVFDAVYDVVKDMPAHVWSRDMMTAYYRMYGANENTLAFYNYASGVTVYRPGTMTPRILFHEALHAATSRSLLASQRLNALVEKLQAIVERRHGMDIGVTGDMPYQVAIRMRGEGGLPGKPVNAREFIAELFSRPEVATMVQNIRLTPGEVVALQKMGYRVDKGRSILRTLWDNFLETIGFKAETPNAYKVAVDMLQDMFEREMFLRRSDEAQGRAPGQIFNPREMANLAQQDPVGGPGLVKAWQAGDHPEVARSLISMADREVLDEKQANKALKYLGQLNEHYWGDDSIGMEPASVTPLSNSQQVQSGVVDHIEQRFGPKAANLAWQFENKFGTAVRKFTQGMKYTNDIGRTLEPMFQQVVQPLKDAWSRRENFAQKYMDTSGANTLIDDIAKMKNGIKDRGLWETFENLLIRESYSRTDASQPLGTGLNAHIKAGDLRDRQSIRDYEVNKKILDDLRARNPELAALRDRIFAFTRQELDQRNQAQVKDMLLSMKVVPHGDEAALSGLTKHIRREDKLITPAERTAMEKITGTDETSKQWRTWEKNREDIRSIVEAQRHNGPHVPFSRHGGHAVSAEYQVTPDKGVDYTEVNAQADTHRMYDFKKLTDAEHFIDNVLGHPDININLRDAHEVVYDTQLGQQAAHWTVTKPDNSAKTYDTVEAAEAAMVKGDKLTKKFTTVKDIEQMKTDNQPTGHLQVRHRVSFNPREFVKFESERDAHNYRDKINQLDHPNLTMKVANVETPHDMIGRANVAYTSAEMRQWINRQEASPEYQRMDPSEKAEWARKLRVEAARVTATAGRRTMNMPRDYAKGASTDILKNMIDYAGANARAIADLNERANIDKGLVDAEAYVAKYKHQSGGMAGNHRARDDAMIELKSRLFAPPRVEDSWATAIKRALQVSMISHLADAGYLIVNALEPWVFAAPISAARHGWARSYGAMVEATQLLDVKKMAAATGRDLKSAAQGKFGRNEYEDLLLQSVTGPNNKRGDGEGLSQMLRHLFSKGLAARDVGMEVERIHDPSKNVVFRGFDWADNVFRGLNTGVETFNRATTAIANYRLEHARALKEGRKGEAAHEQAMRYAEDMIFKGAGDYGSWNNPRYFNNPMLRLATQFKKYPLRIFSVYADALQGAFKGDREKQKQLAYMTMMQIFAAGGMGLPINSFGAAAVNSAYILGWTDNNYEDVELLLRKQLVGMIGVDATDLAMKGALRFTGADFNSKMSQDSFIFRGSPDTGKPGELLSTLGRTMLGAPGNYALGNNGLLSGIQKLGEAASHYDAGATTQAMTSGMEGVSGIAQMKFLTDIVKAAGLATGGPKGMPTGNEASTGQAITQAIGFTPTGIADKQAAKRAVDRESRQESRARKVWTDRWLKASSSSEQAAVWREIQRQYNAGLDDPKLRLQYQDLWKAQQRKKHEERRDDSKLGLKLSGRKAAFADTAGYFDIE